VDLRFGAVVAGFLLCGGALAQDARPALKGVSSVRIANYNSPSVLLEKRADVNAIVSELGQLRRKPWQRGDAKILCYSTIVLMAGKKRVGEYRLTPQLIVERPVDKGQVVQNLAIDPSDLPQLNQLLSEIQPAKDCS
jgi:hypothetical protein